jgi:outer membrane protein assembly factor BamB
MNKAQSGVSPEFVLNRRRCMQLKLIAVVALASLFSCEVPAEDWPQWRGPARNGISQEKNWLDHWPIQGPPIAWKAKVGLGFSSVVVAGGKAITAGHANETDTVFCFDAGTGKELWKHSYPSELGDKFYEGGTTGTATIDGNRVFWLSCWGDLFCFNAADGHIVWKVKIQESDARVPTWGFTGAPTVHGKLLILNVGEAGRALDKNTGETVWASADKDSGYSTPLPIQRTGQWEVLLGNGEAFLAVDLATGRERWRMKWLTQYGVNAADPIPYEDKVFISSGYGKGAALFKPAVAGEPQVIWKSKVLRTQLNPAVLLGKHLYGVDGDTVEKASLKCVEIETGAEKWKVPNFGSGAVMAADGKLIALSATGELIVAPASPNGFKPTARAQILGGKCWTVPVLANGLVYCRNSRGDIVAVDLRKKS